MGNYHLHRFEIDGEDIDGKSRAVKRGNLAGLFSAGIKEFTYVYDFGNNWHHTVVIRRKTVRAGCAYCPRPRQ